MGAIGTFDIFKIGVGPSSSHTMGPWRAAQQFLGRCHGAGVFGRITRVRVDLYGSLAKTGRGHGTDFAVILGLMDEDPATCDTTSIHGKVETVRTRRELALGGMRPIPFDPTGEIAFNRAVSLPYHPNALAFTAMLDDGSTLADTYYSIGGGFVVREGEQDRAEDEGQGSTPGACASPPYPVETSADLLRFCREQGLAIPDVVLRNEAVARSPEEIRAGLEVIWATMRDCAFRGVHAAGTLPGGLGVVRRAAALNRSLLGEEAATVAEADPVSWVGAIRRHGRGFPEVLKWVSCFALAVNEENAAFGRVVTAPTNGAAGVIPAVLLYRVCFHEGGDEAIGPFLLTAGAIGALFKKRATISAAMGGCQAEIGVSSAMAASGLAQTLGATPAQVLMAAEIAMEHHLGLTCDPVGGLVQVPCIERNAMGAVKAITAALLALEGDPARARVTLDAVIRTMWATAQDMSTKYKETSEGGLAVQVPVSLSEC